LDLFSVTCHYYCRSSSEFVCFAVCGNSEWSRLVYSEHIKKNGTEYWETFRNCGRN